MFHEAKNEAKLSAIKRKNYFKRVRKRWKHKDVVEIDENHSKFLFTQYIRFCMRKFLSNNISNQMICDLKQEDFREVGADSFQYSVNNVSLHFQTYAPKVFTYIRYMMGMLPEEYLQIISPMEDDSLYLEFLSNSKSGQNFFLTNNKQLMIKTISRQEVKFFTSILDKYLKHFQNHPHSLLVKFLGLHSIKVKLLQKPVYFIVMLSIFYPSERIQFRYDIKACQIGRFTKPDPDKSNAFMILKEKNWNDNKLALGSQREWFLKQIKIDTAFLKGIGVLDYSLLIGVQPLCKDEKNDTLASVVTRARKSYEKGQGIATDDLPTSSKTIISDKPSTYDDDASYDLPGMIATDPEPLHSSSAATVDADTGEMHLNSLIDSLSFNKAAGDWVDPKTAMRSISKTSSIDMFGRSSNRIVTEEEALRENRRMLPDYKNELHVIDGEEKYFLGIIDFFTRYTFKKKLENAYKRVIYPPLSFSTVHPDIFAERFCKYWIEHTN